LLAKGNAPGPLRRTIARGAEPAADEIATIVSSFANIAGLRVKLTLRAGLSRQSIHPVRGFNRSTNR
jgi:hypothetical protein